MAAKRRKKRVPQLKYTDVQNIGWHVSFRDPKTGKPRQQRFGLISREKAEAAYHDWVAAHLRGETPVRVPKPSRRKLGQQLATPKPKPTGIATDIIPGSLLHVTSGFLSYEECVLGRMTEFVDVEPSLAKPLRHENNSLRTSFSF